MIISVPFTKVKKIFHMADMHVRLFKRHEEYREGLEVLYSQIKAENTDGAINLVAGDVLHAKTDMSPEMVVVASDFLRSLAEIAPTIVIAGNHDLNLSNINRLDSLTPIIQNINHPNLHYFKNSGIYTVADVDFALFSILGDREEWPSHKDCNSKRKIALYHGPVHGALTDANFTITNRHVDMSTFDGYDIVLLGDIHRYQVLQERDVHTNKPIIVYPGSLFQQNHGETVDNHGWCLWDVATCTHVFKPLPNNYGYYTLEFKDGKISYPTDVPKNVRMRIFTGDMDNVAVKKAISSLRKRYNIIELSINKSRYDKKTMKDKAKSNITATDVHDVEVQGRLIEDWLDRTHGSVVSEDLVNKILEINKNLNAQLSNEDHSRNVHWNPIELQFSNILSYGEDNIITFDKMKGLYGIFAPNGSGKSSSMDALIFALYDKTPRVFRGEDIMNNRRNTFECQLKFEINNEIYYIRRVGTRKKNGAVKVDVSFWKENPDGTHTSLNGEDRRDTNANIRNYVGSYEDFVLTTLSGQTGNALFIDKSHSERKDLLIQFMGLGIFDKLADLANDEMKEISSILRKFNKTDFTSVLSETQTNLEASRVNHTTIESDITKEKINQDILYNRLREMESQKRPLPNIELNLDKLHYELANAIDSLSEYKEKHTTILERISVVESDITEKTSLISTYDSASLAESVKRNTELAGVLHKGVNALKVVKTKVEEKSKFKEKLLTYKFNPDCGVCVENNQSHITDLKSVTQELSELINIQLRQESALSDIEEEMKSLAESLSQYHEMCELMYSVDSLEKELQYKKQELETVVLNIDKLSYKITQFESDIELHKINEDNISWNIGLDESIGEVNQEIFKNKNYLGGLEKKLRDLHGEIKVLESTKQNIMNQIKEAEELETSYEAYSYYQNAIGRDGIPYEIVSKAIPNIEAEINNILSQVVEFTISLEVDGKNIVGKLNYEYDRVWPLEASSGMERFISSLAIRVALMTVSNLPKANFLIADEGFGSLDTEHIQAMPILFDILKTQFDFVIIISHLDVMRDMVDTSIEVKREDGFSYINA